MALKLSDGENMLLEGFRALRSVSSRTLTVTTDANIDNDNVSFDAVLLSQQDVIALTNELGEEGRDWMIIEVERPAPGDTAWSAANLELNALVTDTVNNWRLMRRTDNAADVVVRLWFVQIVPGADA
jgi:hypothetical protein